MEDQDRLLPLLNIIELVVLFIVGILGNKIAETFDIPTNSIFVIAVILLIVLSVVIYRKSARLSVDGRYNIRRYIPKTMLGNIPIGILLGFLAGALLPIGGEKEVFVMPYFISRVFGYSGLGLSWYEVVGLTLAVIAAVIIASTIDRYLAAALLFGYGVAFPLAILFVKPSDHLIVPTIAGHSLFCFAVGVLLIFLLPGIKHALRSIREAATTPRL